MSQTLVTLHLMLTFSLRPFLRRMQTLQIVCCTFQRVCPWVAP